MAATGDVKSALLAPELKDFALALPTTVFPKAGSGNFFCGICKQLAFDSWKLLCCNKSICSICYANFEFPTTCPLCDHSPLEAETITVNKSLRNTMRVWLQKQKKKEEAKNAAKLETPPADTPVAIVDAQQASAADDKPIKSVEITSKTEDDASGGVIVHQVDEPGIRDTSVVTPANENNGVLNDEPRQQAYVDHPHAHKSAEPTAEVEDPNVTQKSADGSAGGMYDNNAMFNDMNGMNGQFSFGFNQDPSNFNGMGWNGMNPMNGMPNTMGNGNWNNSMDFNSMNMPNMPNGMYGGFGGNMGMPGMNDMSMMNYGGGYGNGWQGGMNGAGYGNFNGYNSMGGYNQPGAQYPQMMNQFPKNNFPNQNRFHANGAAFPQPKNNRRGSYGNFGIQNGPGLQQNAHSRPGSRSGSLHNRDGQSPAGSAQAPSETMVDGEPPEVSAEPAHEGKANIEDAAVSETSPTVPAGEIATNPKELTRTAEEEGNEKKKMSGLSQIQTVDTIEPESSYDQSMMNGIMQSDQAYPQDMMNSFLKQGPGFNGPYGPGMGFHQSNYNHQGVYNAAYGAATVLTGEPKGMGVEGAPTGPRAMREGRPNTGFSSRAYNAKFQSQQSAPNVPPAQEDPVASKSRGGRSSPERDDDLRIKDKSPSRSRSRSRSRTREEKKYGTRERSRSADGESKRQQRDRSATPGSDDYERRKERRRHRSSRNDDRDDRDDDRDDEYEDRQRDDKDEREDRTRSASADSRNRGRRDKENHRSSRSYRERSRERRRRHRSRSHSPVAKEKSKDDQANVELSSEPNNRRKHHSEKEKYRERDRERSRDRERDRDRRDRRDRDYERDYEYEKEKERAREKDRDRKRSRRDREDGSDDRDRDYEDEKHRSSRRSRKDRDRDRVRNEDSNYEDKEPASARGVSPPLNAPTGPSADGFSIRGFSKTKKENAAAASKPMAPPPTAPRAFQPPKGPAADRDRDRRDSRDPRRKSSISNSMPTTPTTPVEQNHYAAERERHTKDRINRERTSDSQRATLTSKRSHNDFDRDTAVQEKENDERDIKVPTGPAAHRNKRRRSGCGDETIANMFTAGLRKHAAGKRRGGVKNEGDVERELERVERERDRRW